MRLSDYSLDIISSRVIDWCADGGCGSTQALLSWAAASPRSFVSVVRCEPCCCLAGLRLPRLQKTDTGPEFMTAGVSLRAERQGVYINQATRAEEPRAAAAHAELAARLWPGEGLELRLVSLHTATTLELLRLLDNCAVPVCVSVLCAKETCALIGGHARQSGCPPPPRCLRCVTVLQQLGDSISDGVLGGLSMLRSSLGFLKLSSAARSFFELGALQCLKELDASGTCITDAELKTLAGLPLLSRLLLDTCPHVTNLSAFAASRALAHLSAAGCPRLMLVARLRGCSSLRSLDLSECAIPAREMGALLQGLVTVDRAWLNGARLPTDPPPPLAQPLASTIHLHLCGAQIPCVEWLCRCVWLRFLHLDRSSVTDADLRTLAARLVGIEQLSVCNCPQLHTDLAFALDLVSLQVLTVSRTSLVQGSHSESLQHRGSLLLQLS